MRIWYIFMLICAMYMKSIIIIIIVIIIIIKRKFYQAKVLLWGPIIYFNSEAG